MYLNTTPDYKLLTTNQIIEGLQRTLNVSDLSSKSEMIKEYIFNYEEVIFNISYVVSHNYHLLFQQRLRPKQSTFSLLSSAPLAFSTASDSIVTPITALPNTANAPLAPTSNSGSITADMVYYIYLFTCSTIIYELHCFRKWMMGSLKFQMGSLKFQN